MLNMSTLKSIIEDSLSLGYYQTDEDADLKSHTLISPLTNTPYHNHPHHTYRKRDTYSFVLKLLGMFGVCALIALLIFQTLTAITPVFLEVSTSELAGHSTSNDNGASNSLYNLQFTNPIAYSIYSKIQKGGDLLKGKKSVMTPPKVMRYSTIDDSDMIIY